MKISLQEPATMTNAAIVAEYNRLMNRQLEIGDEMIKDGFGHLTPSMMRKNPNIHPLAAEHNSLCDRCMSLGIEADLRYGPGLFSVQGLLSQGKTYRRR